LATRLATDTFDGVVDVRGARGSGSAAQRRRT
jgi:hypothetical protein